MGGGSGGQTWHEPHEVMHERATQGLVCIRNKKNCPGLRGAPIHRVTTGLPLSFLRTEREHTSCRRGCGDTSVGMDSRHLQSLLSGGSVGSSSEVLRETVRADWAGRPPFLLDVSVEIPTPVSFAAHFKALLLALPF